MQVPDASISLHNVFVTFFRLTTLHSQIMDALSTEWRSRVQYAFGDRVAFKITGSLGVAAFECLQTHISTSDNQVSVNDFDNLDIGVTLPKTNISPLQVETRSGSIIRKDFQGVDVDAHIITCPANLEQTNPKFLNVYMTRP